MKKKFQSLLSWCAGVTVLLVFVVDGYSQTSEDRYRPGVLLISFTEEAITSPQFKISRDASGLVTTGLESFDALSRQYKIISISRDEIYAGRDKDLASRLGLHREYVLRTDPKTDMKSLAELFARDSNIESAEPNWLMTLFTAVPNDPYYSENWGHDNYGQFKKYYVNLQGKGSHSGANVGYRGFDSKARRAWNILGNYGDESVVIAIIDTGVDWKHPDLRIWKNSGEQAGNGIDDDGNGFIDDVRGWDFGVGDNDPMDDSQEAGHGTACAGVSAGIANNGIGVAGIAGGCTIMPVKIATADGTLDVLAVANAIKYAGDNGADVISMSFGGNNTTNIKNSCTYAFNKGSVLLAATGNENKSTISFPAANTEVIAVGAASPSGQRKRSSDKMAQVNPGVTPDPCGATTDGEIWWGSNYGKDLKDSAPAVDIIAPTMLPTTDITGPSGFTSGDYLTNSDGLFNGTSCATPYAAGVAALIISRHPSWSPQQVRDRLVQTARDVFDKQWNCNACEATYGWDKFTGYGMVDAGAAVSDDPILQPLIFFEDFECNKVPSPGLWEAKDENSNSGDDYWGISDIKNGGYSFGGDISTFCAANGINNGYNNNMNATLAHSAIDLSMYTFKSISFAMWYKTFDSDDYVLFQYHNGANWTTFPNGKFSNPGDFRTTWVNQTFSIPKDAPCQFQFRWVFVSNGSGVDLGAYVDDIAIRGYYTGIALADTQVPKAPGSIAGPNGLCPPGSGTYQVAPVAGATSYVWKTAGPATLISNNTNTSQADNAVGSFTISVRAKNSCGSGPSSSRFITVYSENSPQCGGKYDSSAPQKGDFDLYPNPATDQISWTLPVRDTEVKEYQIQIMDSFGNAVVDEMRDGSGDTSMNVSLVEGIYIVVITYNDGTLLTDRLLIGSR